MPAPEPHEAPASPAVSIIIPTYQGARYLAETLPAIRTQAYPGPVEIVAIDSSSTDGTRALLDQYGCVVEVIPQSRFSHGYARNLGVARATGAVCVFLSQDALPVGTGWLTGLVAAVADEPVGAAYCQQLPRPAATPFERYFHAALYPGRGALYRPEGLRGAVPSATSAEAPLAAMFFSNVCSVARRAICQRFPFDETLIMSEDQAFAKALLKAGYQTVYTADVQVIHSHHYDLKTLFRRNFDSAYSLRGVAGDTASGQAGRGLRYILGEAGYVLRCGKPWWLAYLPIYEAVRIAGRLAGASADRLPRRWRVAMSLHRGYWARQDAP